MGGSSRSKVHARQANLPNSDDRIRQTAATTSASTGEDGQPETMAAPCAEIEAACQQIGRDPAPLGTTALIGAWFLDLQPERPKGFEDVLTGSAEEFALAMVGYRSLGIQHIMFQSAPDTAESRQRLAAALDLHRRME
jgi:glycosyltransferase A (GT-A) superfamily protein (DUF2064 family)